MTLHHSTTASTSWNTLPETVKTYLTAHDDGENARVLATFTADAVVTDEGHDHAGRERIEAWLNGPASEFTYTTEFLGATTIDDDRVDVLQRLEGNFPGGVADLHYRFTMVGALISRLVIEP
ncbi:MAG: nuclear transport factor 2 family protein [Mycobacterium sp.]|nr:nuclear transport factor 2 family protein [Mycobacterium sp.]